MYQIIGLRAASSNAFTACEKWHSAFVVSATCIPRRQIWVDAACGPADCSLQIAIFRATRIVSNATVDGIRY